MFPPHSPFAESFHPDTQPPLPESPVEQATPVEKDEPSFVPLEVGLYPSQLPEKYAQLLREQDSALLRLPEKFVLPKGVVLIIGANGAGKTTLMRGLSLALFPEQSAHISDATLLRDGLALAFAKTLQVPDDRVALDIESGTLLHAKQTTHLSQRQGLDLMVQKQLAAIDTELEISAGVPNDDVVLFVDEPELGMDPKRQKKILDEVLDLQHIAPLVVVATNSPFLVDSNLPRIDMSQPEKGIIFPEAELQERLSAGFAEGHYTDDADVS